MNTFIRSTPFVVSDTPDGWFGWDEQRNNAVHVSSEWQEENAHGDSYVQLLILYILEQLSAVSDTEIFLEVSYGSEMKA